MPFAWAVVECELLHTGGLDFSGIREGRGVFMKAQITIAIAAIGFVALVFVGMDAIAQGYALAPYSYPFMPITVLEPLW